MKTRELTEKQALFLEVLFGDVAGGSVEKAKKLAGYSDTTPTSAIVKALEEEIIEETKRFLSRAAPKAAFGLMDALDKPNSLGVRNKLSAIAQVLDRVGIVKTEKVEISSGIFVLPPKDA
jgi:hypothetical protein